MRSEVHTRCLRCGVPIQQAVRGRSRRYCGPACRKAAHRARQEAWAPNDPALANVPTVEDVWAAEHGDGFDLKTWWRDCEARGVVPPRRQRWRAVRAPAPSPDRSTVDAVTQTILAALAVAAEFRRHGIAAEGLLAVKCGRVAAVMDEALAAEFGRSLAGC